MHKKKRNQKIFIFFCLPIFLLILFFVFDLSKHSSKSPEISIISISPLGKNGGKVIAASCALGFPYDLTDGPTTCNTTITCNGVAAPKSGTPACGGICTPSNTTCCTNSATNYPACDNNVCTNGATNYPACNVCPTGSAFTTSLQTGLRACSGTCTTTDACGVSKTGTVDANGQCQITPATGCSVSNACGQTFSGYSCPSGCSAVSSGTDINATCFAKFKTTSDTVSPNGSVEFSWQLASVPGVTSKCSFVDLTSNTPRPIPGLQNLDPITDRARITNIQTTTRFCLVCAFIKGGVEIGNAAIHQWVRVVRIGEN